MVCQRWNGLEDCSLLIYDVQSGWRIIHIPSLVVQLYLDAHYALCWCLYLYCVHSSLLQRKLSRSFALRSWQPNAPSQGQY